MTQQQISDNMTKAETIYCERCGEKLNPKKTKWLELSVTDGHYYHELPKGHESQGAFAFGTACATTELKKTKEALNAAKL